MKTTLRLIALLLAMICLLCGCGAKEIAETTAPKQTQATAPTTEPTTEPEPEPEPINTEAALRNALETGGRIIMEGDITLSQSLVVSGKILDGGGYTIYGPELQQEEVETEDGKELQNIKDTETAVLFTSGTVENMTIRGAYRCLGDGNGHSMTGDVRIRNVDAEGTLYALHTRSGNRNGNLYVENCTLRGWININKVNKAQFENCTFGWTSEGKNGYFRCFIDTTLIGCNFENLVKENGSTTRYNISFYSSTSGVTLILEDCYVGDTLITQENVTQLLKVTLRDNTILVRNTEN